MPIDYDKQPSAWQDGYDDFYAWYDALSDMSDDELDAMQFANEPSMPSSVIGVQYEHSAHSDYHSGWEHANYENAYYGDGGLTLNSHRP